MINKAKSMASSAVGTVKTTSNAATMASGNTRKVINNFRSVPNFYFKVKFLPPSKNGAAKAKGAKPAPTGSSKSLATSAMNTAKMALEESFSEVSGLIMTLETESITGGGMQDKQYKVPKGISFDNLVLKRPLMIPESELAKWCETTIKGGMVGIKPKDIMITLMHPITGLTSATWHVHMAYPVKYEVLQLNSENNALAYEQMEFAYQSFEHKPDMASFAANNTATMIL